MSTTALGSFSPLVLSTDVDEAVIAVLRRWMPTYLRQIAIDRALGMSLPAPGASSYLNAIELGEGFDRPLPAVVVTTAELLRAQRISAGYAAAWRSNISVIVRGQGPKETRDLAALYEGAVRLIMLHQAPGSGIIAETTWQPGIGVGPIPDATRQGRYLARGSNSFDVLVDAAVGIGFEPDVPNADQYLPDATVTSVQTDVVGFSPSEPGGPN